MALLSYSGLTNPPQVKHLTHNMTVYDLSTNITLSQGWLNSWNAVELIDFPGGLPTDGPDIVGIVTFVNATISVAFYQCFVLRTTSQTLVMSRNHIDQNITGITGITGVNCNVYITLWL